jgi:hypothetical protein
MGTEDSGYDPDSFKEPDCMTHVFRLVVAATTAAAFHGFVPPPASAQD